MTALPVFGARPGAPGIRLLVVDDEPNIIELLCAALRFAGFTVGSAMTGASALRAAQENQPDLMLLDVMLPDMDGFEVVRRLRAGGDAPPVLFLTAREGTEDKVRGLTLGGDDYITKPFSLEEVIARIYAVLRRTTGASPGAPARMQVADLVLDEDTHEVWRGEDLVHVSPTEYKLLRYLMLNEGRVVSKSQILDHVWAYDFGGDYNIVESYVSYLRRKIDHRDPRLITTVRGVGYLLRGPLHR